jgi:Family of unknown function (DUF5754)
MKELYRARNGGAAPVVLRRAQNSVHKFMAVFPDGPTVRFGLKGFSDYTIHKDKERMKRYITRHVKRENWTRSGGKTAGFWSRWLLWSKPSFRAALKQTEKVLGKKIVYIK